MKTRLNFYAKFWSIGIIQIVSRLLHCTDPYVKVTLMDTKSKFHKTKKTNVKRGSGEPVFNESFTFRLPTAAAVSPEGSRKSFSRGLPLRSLLANVQARVTHKSGGGSSSSGMGSGGPTSPAENTGGGSTGCSGSANVALVAPIITRTRTSTSTVDSGADAVADADDAERLGALSIAPHVLESLVLIVSVFDYRPTKRDELVGRVAFGGASRTCSSTGARLHWVEAFERNTRTGVAQWHELRHFEVDQNNPRSPISSISSN